MNYFKEKILPIILGAIISALGFICISIFSDILPVILPSLQKLAVTLYLKIILFFLVIIMLAGTTIVFLFLKSKPRRPRTMKGKLYNIQWEVEILYNSAHQHEIDINFHWLCPEYKTDLSLKSLDIPGMSVYTLYCEKCKKTHDIIHKGKLIYVSDAERIVRQKVLEKINI